MPPHYPVQVIEIRPGSAADAPAIARVNRESWFAAYEGIIAAPGHRPGDRHRSPQRDGSAALPPHAGGGRRRPPRRRRLRRLWSRTSGGACLPVTPPLPSAASPQAAPVIAPASDSLCSAGLPAASPGPPAASLLTPAGRAGEVGELYAIYVTPAWWSAGVGRALMGSVLPALEAEGYRRVVLWVLADNARARRFYERAGFAPTAAPTSSPASAASSRSATPVTSREHLLDRLARDSQLPVVNVNPSCRDWRPGAVRCPRRWHGSIGMLTAPDERMS